MKNARWLVLTALSLGSPGLVPPCASATPLHQPLAANSLEVNGTPQTLARHKSALRAAPPAALPGGGLHPNAAAGVQRTYSGTQIDVLTYHYDTLRTGWNPTETDLTPATVASASFGQIATLKVDGNVFAQPLIATKIAMPGGGFRELLIVATGHNTVYAFDAHTYHRLWSVNLGTPQATGDVGCGDVNPEYGISSTPVIVRTGPHAGTLYVVAATEPASFSFHTQIHALDLATGADLIPPVEISPSAHLKGGGTIGFDPQNQWNRASLAYASGSIYVGIGSHCDNNAGAISGWLLRYDTSLNLQHAFNTIEASFGYELSSIWMTGFAPAIDPSGNVFVVTGNGYYNYDYKQQKGPRGLGESVLSLSPDLTTINSTFTPATFNQLNNGDTDFGSGGVMLLPTVQGQVAPPLAVAMGKDAVLYLLDQAGLGGKQAHDAGALQATRIGGSGGGVWGGPAYYQGPGGGAVFYQINGDVLRAYGVDTGASPSLTQVAAGTSGGGYGGSLPIVSSHGQTADTGVVWLVRRGAEEVLEAYDAVNLGAPLFAANAGAWSSPGNGNSFVTAMEANGRVYVPAYKTVTVFGLTQ